MHLGNTDRVVEGVWRDVYDNDKAVTFLPWLANRPYAGEKIR